MSGRSGAWLRTCDSSHSILLTRRVATRRQAQGHGKDDLDGAVRVSATACTRLPANDWTWDWKCGSRSIFLLLLLSWKQMGKVPTLLTLQGGIGTYMSCSHGNGLTGKADISNNVRMKRHLPRRLQLSLHVPTLPLTRYCIVSWKSKKQCANHLPPALVRVISSRAGCGNHVHVHVYIQSSENSCSHEHDTINPLH